MTFLADTNILSEPTKSAPDARVVEWLEAHEADFVVDSIVLGELYLGVLALPRGRKRARLEQWFEAVGCGDCRLPALGCRNRRRAPRPRVPGCRTG